MYIQQPTFVCLKFFSSIIDDLDEDDLGQENGTTDTGESGIGESASVSTEPSSTSFQPTYQANLTMRESDRDIINSAVAEEDEAFSIPLDRIAGETPPPVSSQNDTVASDIQEDNDDENDGLQQVEFVLSQMGANHAIFNGHRYCSLNTIGLWALKHHL